MKTFRVFRAIIAVTGLALFFANCKPEKPTPPPPDVTPPELTVPKDTLKYVNLGDKAAVLKDVKAIDSGYIDLTSSVKITNEDALENLGYNTVKFEVSDAAGNKATATRTIVVIGKKLAGTYTVTSQLVGGSSYDYDIFVDESPPNSTIIQFQQFHPPGYFVVQLDGNGSKKLKFRDQRVSYGGNIQVLSGEATFDSVDGTKTDYKLVSITYKFALEHDSTTIEAYTAVCKKN